MDWQAITDEKAKYAAYLCSREWGVKKEAVLERAGGACERCRCNPIDAVHHLTYQRKYAEQLADLQGLCQGCHDFTHGRTDTDPAARRADMRRRLRAAQTHEEARMILAELRG